MSDKNGSEGRIQWSRFFKKLSPYMIQKGLLYLKHYGPREFWIRLHERFEPEEIPYGPWYAAYVPDQTVLDKQRKKKFAYAPLISVVVPAYRTPELFLRQMIDSLEAQTYEDWELCIANASMIARSALAPVSFFNACSAIHSRASSSKSRFTSSMARSFLYCFKIGRASCRERV